MSAMHRTRTARRWSTASWLVSLAVMATLATLADAVADASYESQRRISSTTVLNSSTSSKLR